MSGLRVQTVSVDFGPRMTLIRGPSDTGKSFILAAIDFMLGAKSLQEIPERVGYSTVLLGLTLPDGRDVTLERNVKGGSFTLHDSDLRAVPSGVAEVVLSPIHSASSEENLSNFLLNELALAGREVQKNQKGHTVSLSFRNIAHLCIVDETQMQSKTPPAQTGKYTTRTTEISVLRSLLENDDDSATAVAKSAETSKLTAQAKIEVYDTLLAELEGEMQEAPTEAESAAQLARLADAIAGYGESMKDLRAQRDQVASDRLASQYEASQVGKDVDEASQLLARFGLLNEQYVSDLGRLDMLGEAGSLLGFFDIGACPFCGAEPEHQHANEACEGDATHLNESIESERQRTQALLADLVTTTGDLEGRKTELADRLPAIEQTIADAKAKVEELEQQMQPVASGLEELLKSRSRAESVVALHRRHAALSNARSELVSESAKGPSLVASKMQLAVLADLSTEISACLDAWGVPESNDTRYDRDEQDIVQAAQLRRDHGKGLRSILHAAFTVGLAQFCITQNLPHPGFVVLDSPIVTYRPPDFDGPEEEGEVPSEFAAAFYSDLETRFLGQVIIMENVYPPAPLDARTVEIAFTKTAEGRYGYFPPRIDEALRD